MNADRLQRDSSHAYPMATGDMPVQTAWPGGTAAIALCQYVELGEVPAGDADHCGGTLQVGRVPGHGQRLRVAGEQRDVVVLPYRGLQLVVTGELLAARGAAADVGPQKEADRRARRVGDRYDGGPVRAVRPGLGGGRRRSR